jgi:trehalose/maltose hydrolase-like predicted phosphorylase
MRQIWRAKGGQKNHFALEWLKEEAWPVLSKIGAFLASRASTLEHNKSAWGVLGVQSPNEYASGVDNDIYTNAATKLALEFIGSAAVLVGEGANQTFSTIATNMFIPFNR